MKRLLNILLVLCCFGIILAQNYKIHSLQGDVKVKSGSDTHTAAKGEELKFSDILIIPQDGRVEIYNAIDKRIYRSVRTGSTSVTKLMIDAREVYDDKSKAIGGHTIIGKSSGKKSYVEMGAVHRDSLTYQPEMEYKGHNSISFHDLDPNLDLDSIIYPAPENLYY